MTYRSKVLHPDEICATIVANLCYKKLKTYAALLANSAASDSKKCYTFLKKVQHIFSESAAYLSRECSISFQRVQHIFLDIVSLIFSSLQLSANKAFTKSRISAPCEVLTLSVVSGLCRGIFFILTFFN